jgi:hypothetical protein
MQSTSSAASSEGAGGSQVDGEPASRPPLDELKDRLEQINERVKGFIKERPVACLVGAVALGYAIARIARRRS